MLNKKRILSVLVLIIFVLSLSMSSFAYLVVSMLDGRAGNYKNDMSTVVTEWNNVLSSLKVKVGRLTLPVNTSNYVRFLIGTDDKAPVAGDWSTTVSFTPFSGSYSTYSGYAGSGDIWINSAGYVSGSFKAILSHEIGHVIGLGHSSDANNLMHQSFKASKWNPKDLNATQKQNLKNMLAQYCGTNPCYTDLNANANDGGGRSGG